MARRVGIPLVIAGVVHDAAYFREQVEPYVDGRAVRFVGAVGPAERDRLLGGAAALLHLIDFEEPFGLSVVESLAAGTPVIANPRGSLPELVAHGVTGFLVHVHRRRRAGGSANCGDRPRSVPTRGRVRRFSADRMVDDYERLFRRIVGQ